MSKYKLCEIGFFKNGLNFSADKVDSGCKIIGIPDFGDKYVANIDGLKEINSEIVTSDYYLKENDILLVRSNGNKNLVGRSMIIGEINEPVSFSGFCIRFRVTNNQVLPLYVLYLLKSPLFRKLFSNTQQTSISNLNQDILGNIEFDIPSLNEQHKIVEILHSITLKIETNEKINDNLYQMAMTEYMHMFFNKKANSKFGNLIVEQPKSTIQVNQAQESEGTVPFFTSGDAILTWPTPLVSGRNIFLNTGGNADVKFYIGDSAYSTDTWCITAKDDLTDYLYLFLQSIKLELNLKFFLGTGLKHLQKPMLKDRPIYIPSTVELKKFNDDVMPLMSMISDNVRESKALTSLRDWLLPMLMNGQATITD